MKFPIKNKIKLFLENNPEYKTRLKQYELAEIITGIPAEKIKEANSVLRIIRMETPQNETTHEQQHIALDELGYNGQHIHDLA